MADLTSHKSYRPLTVLSFRLNVILFGNSPWSFHLVNILLHLAMVDRVYRFLLSLVTCDIAFFSSLLFAVHPIHSEAVANCVGRAEIISAHLVLSAIQNRDYPAYSGLYTFMAMMSKETGVMCLAILVALEIILYKFHKCPDQTFSAWIQSDLPIGNRQTAIGLQVCC